MFLNLHHGHAHVMVPFVRSLPLVVAMHWDFLSELCYSCALGYLGVFVRYRLNYFLLFETPASINDLQTIILGVFELQKFLLPNIIGCFVMGILVSWSRNIANFGGRKLFRDYHVGLATGFCGSITTFSSWLATFNSSIFRKFWLLDIICLVLEFCITWSFFSFGEYLCEVSFLLMRLMLQRELPNATNKQIQLIRTTENSSIDKPLSIPHSNLSDDENLQDHNISRSSHVISLNSKNPSSISTICERDHYEKIQNFAMFVLVLISQIILWTIILVDVKDRGTFNMSAYSRNAIRSVAFAPVGVSMRYILKRIESATFPKPEENIFPWSTFLCNISGSCIAAGILFYAPRWSWAQPFVLGFLGSLTTVSSLIKEIKELYSSRGEKGPLYACVYSFVTFAVSIMCIQFVRLHGS